MDRQSGKRHQETPNEKLVRKFKENPLIPIGALLTTGFLINGLFKFGRRDSAGSQVMMRGRIAAQVKTEPNFVQTISPKILSVSVSQY